MDSYSHILVPVDFSQLTRAVLQRGFAEARLHSAQVTVLHVVEYYPTDVPVGYLVPPENANPVEVYEARARERMRELTREVEGPDASQVVLTSNGAAYHEIVRFVADGHFELIVMGYHGRWVSDTLGSTALAVTRHILCDVLLVRGAGRPD